MDIAFHLAWWHIPAVLTVLGLGWAWFWPMEDDGMLGGIVRLMATGAAALVIAIAWAIAGALK